MFKTPMTTIARTTCLLGAIGAICMLTSFTSIGRADIAVENTFTGVAPTDILGNAVGTPFVLGSFDVMGGDFLVVGASFEGSGANPAATTLSFNGNILTPIVTSSLDGENTTIFVLDGATGSGNLVLTPSAPVNFPGFFAVSLSGADAVEASGSFLQARNDDGLRLAGDAFGDLTGTIAGTTDGAYVLSTFIDQGGPNVDVNVTSDFLTESQIFQGGGANGIGSASSAVATGFSDGSDFDVTFSNPTFPDTAFANRSNFSFVSISATAVPEPSSLALLTLGSLGIFARRRKS